MSKDSLDQLIDNLVEQFWRAEPLTESIAEKIDQSKVTQATAYFACMIMAQNMELDPKIKLICDKLLSEMNLKAKAGVKWGK